MNIESSYCYQFYLRQRIPNLSVKRSLIGAHTFLKVVNTKEWQKRKETYLNYCNPKQRHEWGVAPLSIITLLSTGNPQEKWGLVRQPVCRSTREAFEIMAEKSWALVQVLESSPWKYIFTRISRKWTMTMLLSVCNKNKLKSFI